MVESPDDPSVLDRLRSPSKLNAVNGVRGADIRKLPAAASSESKESTYEEKPLPDPNDSTHKAQPEQNIGTNTNAVDAGDQEKRVTTSSDPTQDSSGNGGEAAAIESEVKPSLGRRFYTVLKETLLYSWINVLLIFVPLGIAVKAAGINPTVVFALNAIAIVPLAGLLGHATESVAGEMGDTIGALMNVTFGNAVELIIFIALVKNEIRIVQASLLGSILANLLLILGMCFLLGGLRFREQIYNSTVTQMSACLLSLSVMSLLLPTAFHASFTDNATADSTVLPVSRGTSVILLLVYVLYLLFQLKSHSYLYQSTPQHVIDEESHPGVLHDMLNSSSSSSTSSSSSDSSSHTSSGSNKTAKRLRRVWRGRRRRKSSVSSKDTPTNSTLRTASVSTFGNPTEGVGVDTIGPVPMEPQSEIPALAAIASGDEADTDGEYDRKFHFSRDTTINFRDFEVEKGSGSKSPEARTRKRSKKKGKNAEQHARKHVVKNRVDLPEASSDQQIRPDLVESEDSITHVDNSDETQQQVGNYPRRPFNIRGISVNRPLIPMGMPIMPRMLSSTVFSASNPTGLPPMQVPTGPAVTPRALHRSTSLPSKLDHAANLRASRVPIPATLNASHPAVNVKDEKGRKKHMSRTSAILLLLISTGLVAICAEFLVDSINYLIRHSSVSEAFIGLIVLPIVGNAAEHFTAVSVASKNKMDLAIGVAVGSSIQIALFVTPVIVLLGWILQKDMSLYFSLFETVSLFVSAFIINFLVLDGRSNYLEGALLIAAYMIIAVAAFFFPNSDQQSPVGGSSDHVRRLVVRDAIGV